MDFLELLASEETIEAHKSRLMSQYDCPEPILQKMDQLSAIVEPIEDKLRAEKETIDFYFKDVGTQRFCYAKQLLQVFSVNIEETLEEQYKIAIETKEEVRIQNILNSFDLSNFFDSNTTQKNLGDKSMQLFEILDTLQLSVQEKWDIQSIHYRPQEHFKKLLPILEKTMVLLKEQCNAISKLEDEFNHYWTSYIEEKDFKEFLSEQCNVNLENDGLEIHLIPGIFFYNSVTINFPDTDEIEHNKEIGTELYNTIQVGILVNELFEPRLKATAIQDPCKDLKLLSDRSKFDILTMISKQPAYGQELAQKTNLSKPTVSHHMKALLNAGFVKIVKEENRIYYEMDRGNIEKLLDHIKHLLLD